MLNRKREGRIKKRRKYDVVPSPRWGEGEGKTCERVYTLTPTLSQRERGQMLLLVFAKVTLYFKI